MELKHNFKPAKELKVRIPITTDYQWGTAWTLEQQKAWTSEVYDALLRAGYKMTPSDVSGGCATLHTPEKFSRGELYLHPMEFTGYMPQEDIDKIVEILEGCKTVYKVGKPQIAVVYEASDDMYRKCLADNADVIVEWLKDNKELWNAGFDFAEKYRIPRVGDECVLCSNQVDIVFIETLVRVLEKIGVLK